MLRTEMGFLTILTDKNRGGIEILILILLE